MSISIQVPSVLRDCVEGRIEVKAEATSVAGALAALVERYPLLRRHLFGGAGELRDYVNVYLNQDEVRDLPEGTGTPVRSGDVLLILPSIAGG
jgi:molybdopterin converting factor small subunit